MSLTPTAPTNPSTGDYNFVFATTVPGWTALVGGGTGAGTTFAGLIGGMIEYPTGDDPCNFFIRCTEWI